MQDFVAVTKRFEQSNASKQQAGRASSTATTRAAAAGGAANESNDASFASPGVGEAIAPLSLAGGAGRRGAASLQSNVSGYARRHNKQQQQQQQRDGLGSAPKESNKSEQYMRLMAATMGVQLGFADPTAEPYLGFDTRFDTDDRLTGRGFRDGSNSAVTGGSGSGGSNKSNKSSCHLYASRGATGDAVGECGGRADGSFSRFAPPCRSAPCVAVRDGMGPQSYIHGSSSTVTSSSGSSNSGGSNWQRDGSSAARGEMQLDKDLESIHRRLLELQDAKASARGRGQRDRYCLERQRAKAMAQNGASNGSNSSSPSPADGANSSSSSSGSVLAGAGALQQQQNGGSNGSNSSSPTPLDGANNNSSSSCVEGVGIDAEVERLLREVDKDGTMNAIRLNTQELRHLCE